VNLALAREERAAYSARNAIIGSTRLARRAGIQQAKSATVPSKKVTPINVIGERSWSEN
jgi:hypothetical protein